MECATLPSARNIKIPLACDVVPLVRENINLITVIEENIDYTRVLYKSQVCIVRRVSVLTLGAAICHQHSLAKVLAAPKVLGYWITNSVPPFGMMMYADCGNITIIDHINQAIQISDMSRIRELIYLCITQILKMNRMGIAHSNLHHLCSILVTHSNEIRFTRFEHSRSISGVYSHDVYDFINAVFLLCDAFHPVHKLLIDHPFYDHDYVSSFFNNIPSARPVEYVVSARISEVFQ